MSDQSSIHSTSALRVGANLSPELLQGSNPVKTRTLSVNSVSNSSNNSNSNSNKSNKNTLKSVVSVIRKDMNFGLGPSKKSKKRLVIYCDCD